MNTYELTNIQRKYFGLFLVSENLEKVQMTDLVTVYYQGDKIVKILNYKNGYLEYDVDIETKQRQTLLPKTTRGKEQKLTVPKILKIKGSGIQFSGSFLGGGIHVYDNRRNLFFIKSYAEDGNFNNYTDIENWITNYINKIPPNYFEWLDKEVSQKRLKVKIKAGDIIGFKIGQGEFGFARILMDVFSEKLKGEIFRPELYWVHPRSIIVAPYAYYSNSLQIDTSSLINKKTLPSLCIFDLDVYRGEMPVIGNIPLSPKDKQIPFPKKAVTSITIPYSKTDIETFIATNGAQDKD